MDKKAKTRSEIRFVLNGKLEQVESGIFPIHLTLSQYLREAKHLVGTKVVCAEGDCGACTVLRYAPGQKRKYFVPVNSCILPLPLLDGSQIVTVDALAEKSTHAQEPTLHPVQAQMRNCHASQCGFCTPGFCMALAGLLEKRTNETNLPSARPAKNKTCVAEAISAQQVKNALTGNLCRCTGYRPIVEAGLRACEEVKKSKSAPSATNLKSRFSLVQWEKKLKTLTTIPLQIGEATTGNSHYSPSQLKPAIQYLKKNRNIKIISGGTDLGVVHNKHKSRLARTLYLGNIEDLQQIKIRKNHLSIGAAVSISEFRRFLKSFPSLDELKRYLDLFASPQIKNAATVMGNIVNASPIGDLIPPFLALGAHITLLGPRGKREIGLEHFFLGYRKTAVKVGEFAVALSFEVPDSQTKLKFFKSSQRKDLDISTVSAAFFIGKKVRVAWGGVAAVPLRHLPFESRLQKALNQGDHTLTPQQINGLAQFSRTLFQPVSDLRGSASYRKALLDGFVRKAFQE